MENFWAGKSAKLTAPENTYGVYSNYPTGFDMPETVGKKLMGRVGQLPMLLASTDEKYSRKAQERREKKNIQTRTL